jgi:hypothetical protein
MVYFVSKNNLTTVFETTTLYEVMERPDFFQHGYEKWSERIGEGRKIIEDKEDRRKRSKTDTRDIKKKPQAPCLS